MEIFKIKTKEIKIIFKNNKAFNWSKTHAWVPTPLKIKNDNLIVIYGSRNQRNLTQSGYFSYHLKKQKVISNSKKPFLKLGKLGEFDDSLSLITTFLKLKNLFYFFFVGWIVPNNTRFFPSIGIAKSDLKLKKIEKKSAPLISRSEEESLGVASPFLLHESKKFKMWYVAIRKWIVKKKEKIPIYNLSYSISKNINNWKLVKKNILKSKSNETISRPWVIKYKKKYHMWYSYRKLGGEFKIGYAISSNGINWKRKDKNFSVPIMPGFNEKMSEYPSFFKYKKNFYLLFNGNNYGKTGIGMIELKYEKE